MPLPSEFVESQIGKLEEAQKKLDAIPEPLDPATQAEKDKVNADFKARRELLTEELKQQKALEADQAEKKSLGNTSKALKKAKRDYDRQVAHNKKSKDPVPLDRTKLDQAEKNAEQSKKLSEQIAKKKKDLAELVSKQKVFKKKSRLGDICVRCELAEVEHVAIMSRWNALSPSCQQGLKDALKVGKGTNADVAAKQRLAVLDRARGQKDVIQKAVEGTGVDWTIVAALGIRETGFVNKRQEDGQGVGVFQIDLGQNPGVTDEQAESMEFSAKWAAEYLAKSYNDLHEGFPEMTDDELWRAAAASYNRGLPGVKSDLNHDLSPDAHTLRHNYGSSVVGVDECLE